MTGNGETMSHQWKINRVIFYQHAIYRGHSNKSGYDHFYDRTDQNLTSNSQWYTSIELVGINLLSGPQLLCICMSFLYQYINTRIMGDDVYLQTLFATVNTLYQNKIIWSCSLCTLFCFSCLQPQALYTKGYADIDFLLVCHILVPQQSLSLSVMSL